MYSLLNFDYILYAEDNSNQTYQPADIKVDWHKNVIGTGGGLFDENGNELDNPYWEMFCNS